MERLGMDSVASPLRRPDLLLGGKGKRRTDRASFSRRRWRSNEPTKIAIWRRTHGQDGLISERRFFDFVPSDGPMTPVLELLQEATRDPAYPLEHQILYVTGLSLLHRRPNTHEIAGIIEAMKKLFSLEPMHIRFLFDTGPFSDTTSFSNLEDSYLQELTGSWHPRADRRQWVLCYSLQMLPFRTAFEKEPSTVLGSSEGMRGEQDYTTFKVYQELDFTQNRSACLVTAEFDAGFDAGVVNPLAPMTQYPGLMDDMTLIVASLNLTVHLFSTYAIYQYEETRFGWIRAAIQDLEERTTLSIASTAAIESDIILKATHYRKLLRDVVHALERNRATVRRALASYTGLLDSFADRSMKSRQFHQEEVQFVLFTMETQTAKANNLLRNLSEVLDDVETAVSLQRATLDVDTVKLAYISQNYQRGTASLAILFLPGIFVSTLLSTDIVTTNIGIWLAIVLPLSAFAIVLLRILWQAPVVRAQVEEQGVLDYLRLHFSRYLRFIGIMATDTRIQSEDAGVEKLRY